MPRSEEPLPLEEYSLGSHGPFFGDVAILEIGSADNLSDFKTKLHPEDRHNYLRNRIMVQFASSV